MMRNKPYPLYERELLYDLKSVVHRSAGIDTSGKAFRYTENGNELSVTYQQFKEDVDALGTALYLLGLRGNNHIAILGENSYRWIVTAFAAMNGSNVMVPIDRDLPPDTIKNLLSKADCTALVYSDDYQDIIEEIKDSLTNTIIINMKQAYSGILSFCDLMAMGKEHILSGDTTFITNEIDNTALAAIFFTSGTTGANKGVMLTHKSITMNAIDALRTVELGNQNILLLPLHHSFGFTAGVVAMLYLQSCICINHSLKHVSDDLKKYKPTHLILVPLFVEALYKKVWDTAKKEGKAGLLRFMLNVSNGLLALGIDLRRKLFSSVLGAFGGNLSMIICGGAFLDEKYVKDFRSMGVFISNGYGITECSPIVCGNRNHHFRDGSIGLLFPSCEMKIDAPKSQEEGEMLVRGNYVMLGYYKDEQATASVLKDGWFRTGDIGRIDRDGFIYITGRIKNIIVLSNGENVDPEELEAQLQKIQYVQEVVVREDSTKKGGNTVIIAEIFPDYEAAKTRGIENLQKHFDNSISIFNKTLPAFKQIRRVEIRNTEFPKTTTKKIKRSKEN
jgi:long-chain acyl-CoA synthetase